MQSMVSTQFKLKNKDSKKCASKIIKKQTEINELLMELREKEAQLPPPQPLVTQSTLTHKLKVVWLYLIFNFYLCKLIMNW